MKTAHRQAAQAKRDLHSAWASEPDSDIEVLDYTLAPPDEHDKCTRCGGGHTLNNCPWPKGDE